MNRFILNTDPSSKRVAGTQIPSFWWSRPYEYGWAAQFTGSDYVVLDAACGISHPFKWLLAQSCKETWACDIDPRIESMEEILKEIRDDLGYPAYINAIRNMSTIEKVKLFRSSIASLPKFRNCFDRIFCISTFEHMPKLEQKRTLKEFARVLNPDGLIVLTVDYPMVTPEELFRIARDANLESVGDVELGKPPEGALSFPKRGLYVYRSLLKHRSS